MYSSCLCPHFGGGLATSKAIQDGKKKPGGCRPSCAARQSTGPGVGLPLCSCEQAAPDRGSVGLKMAPTLTGRRASLGCQCKASGTVPARTQYTSH